MIEWYKDNEIGIFFNTIPDVAMRYPTNSMSKKEKNEITKKPFINNSNLEVNIFDYKNGNNYYFEIKKGYVWDGASIPRLFWRLIGAKTDPRFLIPSLIHDKLCENHNFVEYNRYFSSKVFEKLLYVSGVSNFKRWIMFHSVDNFQKICKWRKK